MILVSRLSFYTSWQIKKVSQNTEYSSENTGGTFDVQLSELRKIIVAFYLR